MSEKGGERSKEADQRKKDADSNISYTDSPHQTGNYWDFRLG